MGPEVAALIALVGQTLQKAGIEAARIDGSVRKIASEEKSGDLNLVEIDDWFDLLSGRNYDDFSQEVHLDPYAYLWLTNFKV